MEFENTKLMDLLFSDSTDDSVKDQIAAKVQDAKENGSAELKDGTNDLSFTKDGDLVKITDNNSGEGTIAKINEDGSHSLVAESDIHKESNKSFSNMELDNQYQEEEVKLYSQEDLEEVKYFSDLENETVNIFSDIENIDESDVCFSDLEDKYEDLVTLYSELGQLDEMGYDVVDVMDATLAYSEYLEELAETDLCFSEVAEELADHANDIKEGMVDLIEEPTQENKEYLKDKIDDLHETAKEFSDVIDCEDVIDAMNYYSEIIDYVMTFSDVEEIYDTVYSLNEAADQAIEDQDEELAHKVKALSEDMRVYAAVAENQGHDMDEVHEGLDHVDAKLEGDTAHEADKNESDVHEETKQECEKQYSDNGCNIDTLLFSQIN